MKELKELEAELLKLGEKCPLTRSDIDKINELKVEYKELIKEEAKGSNVQLLTKRLALFNTIKWGNFGQWGNFGHGFPG